jgi:hypothetical protein
MRSPNPSHETTHFAIHQGAQDQVVVIRHQLTRKELDLMHLQGLVHDPLECGEIRIVVKNRCSQVATVQGVVRSASFISTGWSRHRIARGKVENRIIAAIGPQSKRPDPFGFDKRVTQVSLASFLEKAFHEDLPLLAGSLEFAALTENSPAGHELWDVKLVLTYFVASK